MCMEFVHQSRSFLACLLRGRNVPLLMFSSLLGSSACRKRKCSGAVEIAGLVASSFPRKDCSCFIVIPPVSLIWAALLFRSSTLVAGKVTVMA